jgi:hypothetical protein
MKHHRDGVEGSITFRIGGIKLKADFTLTFTITPAEGALQLAKTNFSGVVGQPISDNLGISGGNGGPYTVTEVDSTQLPPGVTIDSTGAVGGTPTQDGVFSVGVSVADSDG